MQDGVTELFQSICAAKAATFLRAPPRFFWDRLRPHGRSMNFTTRLLGLAAAISVGLPAVVVSGRAQSATQSADPANTAVVSGADVYKQRCASCHDQIDARIPTRSALEKLSPARILKTLDFGAMMSIAYPLRRDERDAVAAFLGHGANEPPPPP